MKFCKETLEVLKNFSSINTNIVFRPGSVVTTLSNAKNIYAKAVIKEVIPREFAIYDLNSMLAMITLIDNQELTFQDKKFTAKSEKGEFEYYYTNPEIVQSAPLNEIDHVEVYKFKLMAEDIQMIMKAAAITGAPTISITNINQAVVLSVSDRKNDTASNFKKSVGTAFNSFDVFIAVENLKVIPDAYDVTVARTENGRAKFIHFKDETRQLQYWVACEPGSTIAES